MLTINNLRIERGGRCIVETPELQVGQEQHVAILGPNGAGKSTLLKVICGEWSAQNGQVLFHHQETTRWDRTLLARHLGVLPQASQVEFPFTAFEVVAIGATPLSFKKRELPARVRQFLRKTDCAHLENQPYARLSGGEKQRVQLARVLLQLSQAQKPPLLLMDEPTSAQDLGHQHQLMQLTNLLVNEQQFSVISVLHDLNIASRYADMVWVVDQQRIQRVGTPEQVLTPETVEAHWQYRPEKVEGLHSGFGLL